MENCAKCNKPRFRKRAPYTGALCSYCTKRSNPVFIQRKKAIAKAWSAKKMETNLEYMRERSRSSYRARVLKDEVEVRAKQLATLRAWRKANPGKYRAQKAKRRSALLNAIPPWADLEEIKKVYENCPPGHHVDHIVPLQGRNVCGLHVKWNLQYLSAQENIRKGNRL